MFVSTCCFLGHFAIRLEFRRFREYQSARSCEVLCLSMSRGWVLPGGSVAIATIAPYALIEDRLSESVVFCSKKWDPPPEPQALFGLKEHRNSHP